MLLATEGLNTSLFGERKNLQKIIDYLQDLFSIKFEIINWSGVPEDVFPFQKLKVKCKKEIITMGQPDIDPLADKGEYVDPSKWNQLIADPDTLVIDTRNTYEYQSGSFKGAVQPNTKRFRDFPGQIQSLLSENRKKRVALFCTGGIRCEKATAFLKRIGVQEVYHLKGGVLSYLSKVPKQESQWSGECFIFDDRLLIDHARGYGDFNETYRSCGSTLSEPGSENSTL
jgi:UPF0176 protein